MQAETPARLKPDRSSLLSRPGEPLFRDSSLGRAPGVSGQPIAPLVGGRWIEWAGFPLANLGGTAGLPSRPFLDGSFVLSGKLSADR